MTNYVSGGQKKSKAFKKCERELINAIKNNYTNEKLYKLVQKLRESKIQAFIVDKLPSNLSLEERQQRKDLLIQKWKSYSVDHIIAMYEKF